MENKFKVGDLVKIKDCPHSGAIAYVYEEYKLGSDHFGVSLITSDGRDLGGFNVGEQEQFLDLIKHTDFKYSFHTVIQTIRGPRWREIYYAPGLGNSDKLKTQEIEYIEKYYKVIKRKDDINKLVKKTSNNGTK